MLKLTVVLSESFDDSKNEFVYKEHNLELEHSLASLSKWESMHGKPFLGQEDKTTEETLSYLRMMDLDPHTPAEVFEKLSKENVTTLTEYIGAKMTATTFSEDNSRPSYEIVTSEIIYYWMVTLNIPFECQYWHLNKLLALIRTINLKNAPARKMSEAEHRQRQRAINAQRRAQYGSTG